MSPTSAYLGRTIDVLISGNGTNWDSQATVSFGDGITVGQITVGSPTAILASITVDASAAAGARTITVTDGSSKARLEGIFSVLTPVDATVSGTLAQGSIVQVMLTENDPATPFDDTNDGFGDFTNFNVVAPSGMMTQISYVTPGAAYVYLYIDVDAPTGAFTLDVQSGPSGGTITHFSVPLNLTARTAVDLSSGSANGTEVGAYDSTLYTYSTNAPSTVSFNATSTNGDANPYMFVLPASGHFADELDDGTSLTELSPSPSQYYVLFIDGSGTPNVPFTVMASQTATTFVSPGDSNDVYTSAISLSGLPAAIEGASLDTLTDLWFSFTATEDDVGKSVYVSLLNNFELDPSIDVLDSTAAVSLGGPFEDVYSCVSDTISSAGTYYVHIFDGNEFGPPYGEFNIYVNIQ